MDMAIEIGVRELKNHTSKIVRAVREEAAEYVITVHGEPVALLRPLTELEEQKTRREKAVQFLEDLDELAWLVTAEWQSDQSGLALIEQQRREL